MMRAEGSDLRFVTRASNFAQPSPDGRALMGRNTGLVVSPPNRLWVTARRCRRRSRWISNRYATTHSCL